MSDPAYYGHRRDDIIGLVPERARRVLSIGCGAGVTEAALRDRGHEVTGVEPVAEAAAAASAKGLEVHATDAMTVVGHLSGRRFDCLIYADVLEHIVDPEATLDAHLPLLEPGGVVIISVPNFRHIGTAYHLFLRGVIPYADAGIYDRTHVRITTRRLVRSWLEPRGLSVDRDIARLARRRDRLIGRMTFGLLDELLAQQILIRAILPRATAP